MSAQRTRAGTPAASRHPLSLVPLRMLLRLKQVRWFVARAGFGTAIPEDLYHLIKKAVSVRKHLERNRKDRDSKFRLILIESRIHRLARYYRLAKKLPSNWK